MLIPLQSQLLALGAYVARDDLSVVYAFDAGDKFSAMRVDRTASVWERCSIAADSF